MTIIKLFVSKLLIATSDAITIINTKLSVFPTLNRVQHSCSWSCGNTESSPTFHDSILVRYCESNS